MGSSEATTRRRVKLYMLNDERQWDDKGTGHVSAVCTEQDNMALVVISETDGSYLLESRILPDTAYQKQQETLIVWSEGDNMDLALSFQEKVGCDDVWEKICAVQGKDPSVEITQEVVDESDDADDTDGYTPIVIQSVQPLPLPPCEFSHLEETVDLIIQAVLSPQKRERLVVLLESTNYLNQLVDLFHKAEDLEDLKSLHHLYEIMRQLILINKHSFYETLFAEDMLMDVIGMLEYNPAGRTKHRDFLRNKATFREVIPLRNTELIGRIHQTYRVQYIQECCLPPPCLFDEQTLSQLKTFVSLNKLEIIRALQDDEEFMCRLFARLKSPDIDLAHRRELSLFVKEFCNISIQTEQKESFLSCLFQHGALRVAEVLLAISDKDIKSAALEILQAFVEHQPSAVRGYVYRETAPTRKDDDLLINLMINQLLADSDPGKLWLNYHTHSLELSDAFILGYMLRILIDPDNMNNTGVRGEKTEFLSFFYKRCINTLVRPLFENTAEDMLQKDDYHTALVLNHVLELLTFCIETHTYHMKNYCFNRDLLKRVLVLLQSSHKFLVLASLRLLRRVVHMKEEFYNRYLIKNNLFKPVIKLFVANGHRYNLLDSAIIELFEYIRSEKISSLITHVVENFWDILKNVNYVQTFSDLKRVYDHSHRPTRPTLVGSVGHQTTLDVLSLVNVSSTRFQRDARALEMEEEQWFDQDDDDDEEDEETHLFPSQSTPLVNGAVNGVGSTNALPSNTITDGLPTMPSFEPHPVGAGTPSSELLGISALTSQQSPFSLSISPTTRDSVFSPSPSSTASLFKSGVDSEVLPVVSPTRPQEFADSRSRHSVIDEALPLTRPIPRQTLPISIHLKSELPTSTSHDSLHDQAALVSDSTLREEDSSADVPNKEKSSSDVEAEEPTSSMPHASEPLHGKRAVSAGEECLKASKRSKKPRTILANVPSLVPSVASLFSDDLNSYSGTTNPMDVLPKSPTDNVDAEMSSVGLVDYSDEESDEEDTTGRTVENGVDEKAMAVTTSGTLGDKVASDDISCEVSSSLSSTEVS
ncbi:hypothetical protein T265_12584 [Opisthorchis viverrini]|uniref:Uncharacterized protein n=1 Tax=Opisthorchis viverrini TaxID=6198 RepID=A0A075AJN7_OPIVI|nr:hypothetical protein T265_12584 [Opisthorchis viverrini]KER33704.1 hypothetical protein T265_12584 [Opisthorchis viverrini]